VFNIVAETPVTIRSLADLVVDTFPTELTFTESRPGDVHPARVSSVKALDILGWKAEIPFAEGVKELLETADAG
jgi:nucleoside-diphosphate-sugar epimerase